MTEKNNQQIILTTRPHDTPRPEHFKRIDAAIPTIKAGEALCRVRYLSLDPYMRGQISGRHISGTVNPGDMLRGQTIGEVIESKHDDYQIGDMLIFHGGWQQYALTDGQETERLDPRIEAHSLSLGILGMPGLTAWAGLLSLGEPKAGDTLVVSAASGAVGSMVGQIGRIKGCRTIGLAGSDEKCRWVVEQAGFDACINYRTQDLASALDELAPDGIDIYFDNAGGAVLDTCLWRLALGGRVILCGLMAQYNSDTLPPGPNPAALIKSRGIMRGLVVYDFMHQQQAFLDDALAWVKAGEIIAREDIHDGLDAAPAAFCRLMAGDNFGKTIIRL